MKDLKENGGSSKILKNACFGTCLLAIGAASIAFRLQPIAVYGVEDMLHNYDPHFNFRVATFLGKHGILRYWQWHDKKSWYPQGRRISHTTYPGLMLAACALHSLLNWAAHFTGSQRIFTLKTVCVAMPAMASAFSCAAVALIVRAAEGGGLAAVAAAFFMAFLPSNYSRSVAGSFDYEAIAVPCMLLAFALWIRALRTNDRDNSHVQRCNVEAAALCYAAMVVCWGGHVFALNIVALHTALRLCAEKGNSRQTAAAAFEKWWGMGSVAAFTLPCVRSQMFFAAEFWLPNAVFVVCVWLRARNPSFHFSTSQSAMRSAVCIAVTLATITNAFTNKAVSPINGRVYHVIGVFLSLFGAKSRRLAASHPLVASIGEHQVADWQTVKDDFHVTLLFAVAGIFIAVKNKATTIMATMIPTGKTKRNSAVTQFLALWTVVAVAAGLSMVRLLVLAGPVLCIWAGVAVEHAAVFIRRSDRKNAPRTITWIVALALAGVAFVRHSIRFCNEAYTCPMTVLPHIDASGRIVGVARDTLQACEWLRKNTPLSATVLAWWDAGYAITTLADRATFIDNYTGNWARIAAVAQILTGNEEAAAKTCAAERVNFVWVQCGGGGGELGSAGFAGEDAAKMPWILRIAKNAYPEAYASADWDAFLAADEETPSVRASLLHRLCVGDRRLRHFKRVFSSSHFLVHIFRFHAAAQ